MQCTSDSPVSLGKKGKLKSFCLFGASPTTNVQGSRQSKIHPSGIIAASGWSAAAIEFSQSRGQRERILRSDFTCFCGLSSSYLVVPGWPIFLLEASSLSGILEPHFHSSLPMHRLGSNPLRTNPATTAYDQVVDRERER